MALTACRAARKFGPEPASLPSDQMTTDGWFLKYSTLATLRSTWAASHDLGLDSDSRAVAVAVRLDVRLGVQVDAVLVAQLVPARVVGVVAGPHVVAVALLEHLQVADHPLFADVVAGVGPVLVAVGALELDRHAVDREDAALDLDLAEPGPAGEDFGRLIACRCRRQHRRVQVRRLRGPLGRIGHLQ